MTCWQNLQVRVQVQVHSFQVHSESLEPKSKSKSSKKGLKSGLESKSGLEYYKSGSWSSICGQTVKCQGHRINMCNFVIIVTTNKLQTHSPDGASNIRI